MKNKEVVDAFFQRRCAVNSTGSLHSDGVRLFSYSTCIAEFDKHGMLWINTTKYSTTTSRHQHYVRAHGTERVEVDNIQRGSIYIVPPNQRSNNLL